MQAKEFGGLRDRTRAALIEDGSAVSKVPKAPTKSLKAGTRLVREWHGESHVVDVVGEGYLYRGDLYKSLSKIAASITGAKWSGPRFFGVSSK